MPVSYQTIKLSRGKHSSPEDGACVMELASMLAGEPFTDNPKSVCPTIGSFLRAYNDALDDDRRQDLYAYAAKVVGSAGPPELRRARTERLEEWGSDMLRRRFRRLIRPTGVSLLARFWKPTIIRTGSCAVRAISKPSDETHAAVLALIDELLTIGPSDVTASAPSDADRPAPICLSDAALAGHQTQQIDRARRHRLINP